MQIRGRRSARLKVRRLPTILRLETLEPRQVLTASTASTLALSGWFDNYLAAGQQHHASTPSLTVRDSAATGSLAPVYGPLPPSAATTNVYDWIVQFSNARIAGLTSVAQTASLLPSGAGQLQVLEGLGSPGCVLVRSTGASVASVTAAFRADTAITSFEQDSVRQVTAVPDDPQFSQEWALQNAAQSGGTPGADIHASAAWNLATGSRNVVVAVLDTGVDYTHPDLVANMWTNPVAGNDGFSGDLHGYDFVTNTGNPMDTNGHGTHVAGIIGATGNNGQGVTGVNWNVSIMALRFMDGEGNGYTSDAIRAINYTVMMRTQFGVNVRVINASWGGDGLDPGLNSAIQNAGNAGILFVTAAGNSANNNDATPQYPASYNQPSLVTVAATDANDRLATFSNYGANSVAIAAPGVGIYSTLPGGRYGFLSGTSMATPEVAGVAALAWSAVPGATVAQIRAALLQGADPLSTLNGKVTSGGRVDAYNTLRILMQKTGGTPVIGSIAASPGAVAAGASVTLSAQGVKEDGGTISNVSFYLDANSNGQWDTGDRLLGSSGTPTAGQANFTMNTSGYAAGTYRVFARAVDTSGQWSAPVVTLVTVTTAGAPGTSIATAVEATVGSTVQGTIRTDREANYFKFQAVAGQKYTLQTTLGTLSDSVLTLLGTDGRSVLAQNDDMAPGNRASLIQWQAATSGTYYLGVTNYPGTGAGTFAVQLTAASTGPMLVPIADQTLQSGGTLTLPLSASGAGSVSYSATAVAVDPATSRAYNLSQQLGLSTTTQYRDNSRGWQEKYLGGSQGRVYFLMPGGGLYQLVSGAAVSQNPLVAQLSPVYYALPRLLTSPVQPTPAPMAGSAVKLSTSGNVLTIRAEASFTGTFQVIVTATSGGVSKSQTFTVTVTAGTRAAQVASATADSVSATNGPMAPSGMNLSAVDAYYRSMAGAP